MIKKTSTALPRIEPAYPNDEKYDQDEVNKIVENFSNTKQYIGKDLISYLLNEKILLNLRNGMARTKQGLHVNMKPFIKTIITANMSIDKYEDVLEEIFPQIPRKYIFNKKITERFTDGKYSFPTHIKKFKLDNGGMENDNSNNIIAGGGKSILKVKKHKKFPINWIFY